jgi:predicted ArsR family transcriptional regulator
MTPARPAAGLSDLGPLSALTDGVRRRLYELVAEAGRPVGRDEAAAGAGVTRSLAAYHLDALAKQGLLEVEYRRPAGRSGPGAGRPAKLYRRAEREFAAQVPPRDYRLLADLLVRAAAGERNASVRARIEQGARELGRSYGEAGAGSLADALRARGYEPVEAEPGTLRLRNCPFDTVAGSYPEVVCGLNLAFVQGLIEGLGAEASATLAPLPGACCVAITTSA